MRLRAPTWVVRELLSWWLDWIKKLQSLIKEIHSCGWTSFYRFALCSLPLPTSASKESTLPRELQRTYLSWPKEGDKKKIFDLLAIFIIFWSTLLTREYYHINLFHPQTTFLTNPTGLHTAGYCERRRKAEPPWHFDTKCNLKVHYLFYSFLFIQQLPLPL